LAWVSRRNIELVCPPEDGYPYRPEIELATIESQVQRLEAKFHYASLFGAGSELVRS